MERSLYQWSQQLLVEFQQMMRAKRNRCLFTYNDNSIYLFLVCIDCVGYLADRNELIIAG